MLQNPVAYQLLHRISVEFDRCLVGAAQQGVTSAAVKAVQATAVDQKLAPGVVEGRRLCVCCGLRQAQASRELGSGLRVLANIKPRGYGISLG
jgi:hypothetical protein